jgi:hypothetical protein
LEKERSSQQNLLRNGASKWRGDNMDAPKTQIPQSVSAIEGDLKFSTVCNCKSLDDSFPPQPRHVSSYLDTPLLLLALRSLKNKVQNSSLSETEKYEILKLEKGFDKLSRERGWL